MTATGALPHSRSLLAYRIMAFVTGVVLIVSTILLIVQEVGDVHRIDTGVGMLWTAHGWLFFIYVIATLNLGIKLRWSLVRMGLVALAGTIPTMSFVAEHIVTKRVRAQYGGSATQRAAERTP